MADFKLERLESFSGRKGPQVIVIMDGVGLGPDYEGNAVKLARTPTLDNLFKTCPWTKLRAHGKSVGLPSDDDMGNSEVGHNAIGAGRIFAQGAKLVNNAIESGKLFEGEVWEKAIGSVISNNKKLHFIGLLSDGNVHSHLNHLFALLKEASSQGVKKVRVHTLLDGRDVDPISAHLYVAQLEEVLSQINQNMDRDYCIASGGGRMVVTMDRYFANWSVVERGWKAHVLGDGRAFKSALEAIETYRNEEPELQDQNMLEFVIVDDKGTPRGTIEDGDSVICFNYRGDRSIEISMAFEHQDFNEFNRRRYPQVFYAGIMQYDGDLQVPKNFLVTPPAIDATMGEYLASNKIQQFACSETQKYGHVTYFWNGNRSGMFNEKHETYKEITSDLVPFNQRPWMKAAEITDEIINSIYLGKYSQIRVNFPNGDMVGHTGDLDAAVLAIATVDLCLARILNVIKEQQGMALITADHGNADEMYELDKKKGVIRLDCNGHPKSLVSHTLNPVPFIIYDPSFKGEYRLSADEDAGLSNIASTAISLLGYKPPEDYRKSLVEFVK